MNTDWYWLLPALFIIGLFGFAFGWLVFCRPSGGWKIPGSTKRW